MTTNALEQAARWHARLEDAPDGASLDAAQVCFEAWRHTHGGNSRAYAAVAAIDAVACELGSEDALRQMADDALARADARSGNIPRRGAAALIALLVALPVAALTLRHVGSPPSPPGVPMQQSRTFATDIGQRRLVTLGDTTRILLDTASRLTVRGSTLSVQGQALITAGRSPVVLNVGDRRVRIRSGSLNARIEADRVELLAQGAGTEVTVAEGVSAPPAALPPGDLLSIDGGKARVVRAPDPGAIAGWQTGWLQFDDVPLARAVREVNRYRPVRIGIVGDVAPLRISGSFRTGSDDTFLDLVAATLPVRINRAGGRPRIVATGR